MGNSLAKSSDKKMAARESDNAAQLKRLLGLLRRPALPSSDYNRNATVDPLEKSPLKSNPASDDAIHISLQTIDKDINSSLNLPSNNNDSSVSSISASTSTTNNDDDNDKYSGSINSSPVKPDGNQEGSLDDTKRDRRGSSASSSSRPSSTSSVSMCNLAGRSSRNLKADIEALNNIMLQLSIDEMSRQLDALLEDGIVAILIDIFEDASGHKNTLIAAFGVLNFILNAASGETYLTIAKSYCDGRLLSTLMNMARYEHLEVQLEIYRILNTLSQVEELKVGMGKSSLEMLSMFSSLIYEERGTVRLLSCQIIANLSTASSNQMQMLELVVKTRLGEAIPFVAILYSVMKDDRGESRALAVQAMANLSATNRINVSDDTYSDVISLMISLLDVKEKIKINDDSTSDKLIDRNSVNSNHMDLIQAAIMMDALQLNICTFFVNVTSANNEAIASENRKYLISPSSNFNLLSCLITIIRVDKEELRIRASAIIWSLSIELETHLRLCDPELGLLYALAFVLQDDHYKTQQSKVYTCRTLKNLASTPQSHPHMLASDLNLLLLMMDIVKEDKSYSCVNICAVLSYFAEFEVNRPKLVAPDLYLFSTLGSVIRRGKGDHRLYSCMILQKFSTNYDFKISLLSSSHGLLSSFAMVMGEDKTDARVHACSAMYNLILDFDERILTSSRGAVSRSGHELITSITKLLREEKCDPRARILSLKILEHLSHSQGNQSVMATTQHGNNELITAMLRVSVSPLLSEEEISLICSFFCNVSSAHENRILLADIETNSSKGLAASKETFLKGFYDSLFAKLRLKYDSEELGNKIRLSICGSFSNFSGSKMLLPSTEVSLILCRLLQTEHFDVSLSRLRTAVYTIFYNLSIHDDHLEILCQPERDGVTSIVKTLLTAITSSYLTVTEPWTKAIKAIWNIAREVADGTVPKELVDLVKAPNDFLRLDVYSALWNQTEKSIPCLEKNINTFVKSGLHLSLLQIFCSGIYSGEAIDSTEEQKSMILNILLNLCLYSVVRQDLAKNDYVVSLSKWLDYGGIIGLKSRILYSMLLTNYSIQDEAVRPEIFDSVIRTFDHTLRNEGGTFWDMGTFTFDVVINAILSLSKVSLYFDLFADSVGLLSLLLKSLILFSKSKDSKSGLSDQRRLKENLDNSVDIIEVVFNISNLFESNEVLVDIFMDPDLIHVEVSSDIQYQRTKSFADNFAANNNRSSVLPSNFYSALVNIGKIMEDTFTADTKMQIKKLCERLQSKFRSAPDKKADSVHTPSSSSSSPSPSKAKGGHSSLSPILEQRGNGDDEGDGNEDGIGGGNDAPNREIPISSSKILLIPASPLPADTSTSEEDDGKIRDAALLVPSGYGETGTGSCGRSKNDSANSHDYSSNDNNNQSYEGGDSNSNEKNNINDSNYDNDNSSDISSAVTVSSHVFPPEFDQFKPLQAPYLSIFNNLSEESISIFQVYAGLKLSNSLTFKWQQVASKKLATVWTSSVLGSPMSAIRCSAVIPNASVVDLLKILLNDDLIKDVDDMVDRVVFISNVNERARLARVAMKGIWPTSPRDFLCCTTWRIFPDGSVIIASRSPSDDSACAHVEGFVRGSVHVSGYLIQPSEAVGDPSSCPKGSVKITLQAHSELGGSLPTSIINKLSSTAPMNILNTIADIVAR